MKIELLKVQERKMNFCDTLGTKMIFYPPPFSFLFLIWLGFGFLGPKSIRFIFLKQIYRYVSFIGFGERNFELKKNSFGK